MTALIDGFAVDHEVAEEAICEECGASMTFDPRPGEEGERYQAWAVCTNPDCDYEYEF